MADPKLVRLSECCSQSALTVAGDNLIENVRVLGFASKNGRRYLPEAVAAALPMYEGVRVFVNHPLKHQEAFANRPVNDLFGRLVNVRLDGGDGVRASLEFNPKHPLAEQIVWAATHQPETLGLSHNSLGMGDNAGGQFVVNKLVAVKSVDIVTEPATTKNLFEEYMGPETVDTPAVVDPPADAGGDYQTKLGELVASIMTDDSLPKADKRKKLLAALKLMDDDGSDSTPAPDEGGKAGDDVQEAVKACAASADPNVKRLVEAFDKLYAEKTVGQLRAKAQTLCEAAKLPKAAVSEVFLESLLACDEAGMKKLIEDRKTLLGVQKPRASGPARPGVGTPSPANTATISTDDFARQVKR